MKNIFFRILKFLSGIDNHSVFLSEFKGRHVTCFIDLNDICRITALKTIGNDVYLMENPSLQYTDYKFGRYVLPYDFNLIKMVTIETESSI